MTVFDISTIQGTDTYASMDIEDPLEDFARLLNVRHAALLHADLHDAAVVVLSFDNGITFAQLVRERLFDVDVLVRFTSGDRQRDVPVIRCADDYRIHILAL